MDWEKSTGGNFEMTYILYFDSIFTRKVNEGQKNIQVWDKKLQKHIWYYNMSNITQYTKINLKMPK